MTTSKIRIKLGAIEVEYEGSESFLKEELPQLLSAVSDLYAKSNVEVVAANNGSPQGSTGAGGKKIEMTTASAAAKLQVKSGPELLMAAMARLTLALGQEVCTRQRINEEMKSATAYYKPSYTSNLSKMLTQLVKDDKLNEPSKDNYALTAPARTELEKRFV